MDIKKMIQELIYVNNLDWDIPTDIESQVEMLDALRTICVPCKLSEDYYISEREYIAKKNENSKIVNAKDITEKLNDNIYIYLGDITKIKADAIVNAANEKLLGCFIPGHKCIDNAIHMAAGLKLRNACNEIMEAQGHDEESGTAKITKGYELPAKYVIHTVGPNIHRLKNIGDRGQLAEKIEEQLSSSYSSILNLVNEKYDIKTLVFCSISTGVYGVPIEFASRIALDTISRFLEKNNGLEKVIINVFSQEDYNEYKKQAKQI